MTLFERYRPKDWNEFVGNNDIVEKVKWMVENNKLSHMLFLGSPGTGKTSLAHVLSRKVLGEYFSLNFKEMNASNERGIDKLRQQILPFVKSMSIGSSIKILFIDEADGILQDAQQLMRRVMETYSGVIFILAANDGHAIIKPIASRCVSFNFRKLSDDEIRKIVIMVIEQEKLQITEVDIDVVVRKSNGDARIAINMLFGNIEVLSKWDFTKIPQDLVQITKHVRMIVRRGEQNLYIYNLFDWLEEQNKVNENIIKIFSDVEFRIQNSQFSDPHLLYLLFELRRQKVI